MNSKLFWLGSALCGALLVNGCSSTTTTDGGTSTAGTSGSGGTTSASTSGSTSAGTTGSTTSSSTGTTTGTTTGTSTGTGTTTGTSTGGTMLGTSCDPNATPDTVCAPAGYFCDPTTNACIYPPELNAPCLASVGCATGFSCISGFGTGGTTSLCLQDCSTTPACKTSWTACGTMGGTMVCLPNGCNTAYAACNSAGTNDGSCYPIFGDTTLFCEQGGAAAANQPCGNTRGGSPDLCVANDVCVVFNQAGTLSACLQACAASTPPDGPNCSAGSTCVSISNGGTGTFGACLQTCTGSDCPAPLTCQDFGAPIGMACAP